MDRSRPFRVPIFRSTSGTCCLGPAVFSSYPASFISVSSAVIPPSPSNKSVDTSKSCAVICERGPFRIASVFDCPGGSLGMSTGSIVPICKCPRARGIYLLASAECCHSRSNFPVCGTSQLLCCPPRCAPQR